MRCRSWYRRIVELEWCNVLLQYVSDNLIGPNQVMVLRIGPKLQLPSFCPDFERLSALIILFKSDSHREKANITGIRQSQSKDRPPDRLFRNAGMTVAGSCLHVRSQGTPTRPSGLANLQATSQLKS